MRLGESAPTTLVFALFIAACDSGSSSDPPSGSGGAGSGGAAVMGGSSSAGASTGGSSGGSTTGGASTMGGALSGGSVGTTGGAAPGGAASGGSAGSTPTGGSGGDSAGAGGGKNPCADAIYCDDFEKYAPGKAPDGVFKTRLGSGTVSVDETQHVSGARSVKFTTEAKDGTKTAFLRLEGNSVFPVAGNVYYGRMMFRLEAAPTTAVHWTLIQGGGTVPGQTYHAQYRYGGQHPVTTNGTFTGNQLMANYETPDSYSGVGPKSDCWLHANKRVVPVEKWTCVEWKFDGPQNQMRLWMDGAPLDDLSVNGVGQGCVHQPGTYTWTAPTFEYLDIGWEAYQNDTARTLYIDDLVISKSPIGCP
jgi:hypothetical protein